ncbi:hypothetical protein [Nocardia sp. NPDC051570]|uniref:hypothetical protein n=1 Tax=Nocardia sp. NPDC051570 TaxID=3364324 RepID=UPI00379CD48B
MPRHETPAHRRSRGGRAAVRGYLVGATVAALAVAAHGISGGGYPDSTGLSLLVSIAGGIGALAGMLPATGARTGRVALFAALAGGQWAGHEALAGLAGHRHESAGMAMSFAAYQLPAGAMIAAHAVAALACALLIAAVERLYSVVARAYRDAVDRPRTLVALGGAPGRAAALPYVYTLLRSGFLGSRAPPAPVR